MNERETPVSSIHTEKYTAWEGKLQDRKRIVWGAILEGVKHNLGNKWVRVLIGIALIFTLFIPLLMASFGGLDLMRDADDGAFQGHGDGNFDVLDEYELGFPLSETIQQNETAVYNITLMNTGERSDVVTVFISSMEERWNASLKLAGENDSFGHLNFTLPPRGLVRFQLLVFPPPELVSGRGEVVIEAESQGAKVISSGFRGASGVTKRVTTITDVGHTETSPLHFVMSTGQPVKNVSADGVVAFSMEISNTGLYEDGYAIQIVGLPEDR